ncbi:regulatory protein RecX [Kistimonas asteriae]|uniref:regulatory protein RecX n=1 Tax=Kistimonas asteriae TaxID=517724 RepID=UPI001BA8F140|nr:regulatory protein RecX [Kistimonas asteriae]
MSSSETELRRAAMDLLSRREHSRKELWQKLRNRAETPEMLEVVLGTLEADRLLSDERFAESFVRSRVSRGLGPTRIKQELLQKGIAADLVSMQLEAFDEDWLQQAQDVNVKKFGTTPVKDPKEKAKRVRYLQYRGFHIDTILAVVDGRRNDE